MSNTVTITSYESVLNGEIFIDPGKNFTYKGIDFSIDTVYEKEFEADHYIISFNPEQNPILENIYFCSGNTPKDAVAYFIDIIDGLLDEEE